MSASGLAVAAGAALVAVGCALAVRSARAERGVGGGAAETQPEGESGEGAGSRRPRSGFTEHDAASWLSRCAAVARRRGDDVTGETGRVPTLLFVAGDRSQVGKSSTCLGIMGVLHERLGFAARDLAYIKPATQCEGTQLISLYCKARGIACEGIGPVVFFSGFTRSFLKGEQGTSEDLLRRIEDAVHALGRGKRIVVVDGVGYPSVGSICGISNAAVAKALKCPVLLVGKKGVGDAVDSFNLNACFFESQGIPVLGGVFNRLPNDAKGYYSLEKCKQAVTSYFEQYRPKQMPFGFVPEVPELAAPGGATDESENADSAEAKASALIEAFWQHVDVRRLVQAADEKSLEMSDPRAAVEVTTGAIVSRPTYAGPGTTSRRRPGKVKSRDEVFQAEQQQGAQATK